MASKTLVILMLGALAWQSLFSGNILMALFFILFDLYLISEQLLFNLKVKIKLKYGGNNYV